MDVLRKFQGRLKIEGCFEGVLRVFQGSFKGVSLKFQGRGSFKDVSRVFHDSKGCFQSILKVFQ